MKSKAVELVFERFFDDEDTESIEIYVDEINGLGLNGVKQRNFSIAKDEVVIDIESELIWWDVSVDKYADHNDHVRRYDKEHYKRSIFVPFENIVRLVIETKHEITEGRTYEEVAEAARRVRERR